MFCKDCKAHTCLKKPIKERFGNGKYMFVLDKPSVGDYQTDKQFEKLSEKYIQNLMNSAGFKNSDVSFTYLVRCPVSSVAKYQIQACKKYLWKDMLEVIPHTLFTFGEKTAEVFTQQKEPFVSMSRVFGDMNVDINTLPSLGHLINRGMAVTDKTLEFIQECKKRREREISQKS